MNVHLEPFRVLASAARDSIDKVLCAPVGTELSDRLHTAERAVDAATSAAALDLHATDGARVLLGNARTSLAEAAHLFTMPQPQAHVLGMDALRGARSALDIVGY